MTELNRRAWLTGTAAMAGAALLRARPAAAQSSDLSCPRGRLPPERDTLRAPSGRSVR